MGGQESPMPSQHGNYARAAPGLSGVALAFTQIPFAGVLQTFERLPRMACQWRRRVQQGRANQCVDLLVRTYCSCFDLCPCAAQPQPAEASTAREPLESNRAEFAGPCACGQGELVDGT